MNRRPRTRVRSFVAFIAGASGLCAISSLTLERALAQVAVDGVHVEAARAPAQSDALRNIRAKDPTDRQVAALDLAADPSPKAEGALIKAARGDDDLLVVLAAIQGLKGRPVNKAITKGLVEVALESPFTEARVSAARILGGCADGSAMAALLKKCSGKTFFVAAAALAQCVEASEAPPAADERSAAKDVKRLAKGLKSKEPAERPAAARAMVSLARGADAIRAEALVETVMDRLDEPADIAVVCAALDAVAEAPTPADAVTLRPALAAMGMAAVIERRLESAIAGSLGTMSPADARAFLAGCFERADGEPIAASAEARPRLARVLGAGTVGGEGAAPWIERLLTAEDVPTRAAAAHAMDIMGEAAVGLAEETLAGEFDARVQLQLVELLAARVDVTEGADRDALAPPVLALVELLEAGSSERVLEAVAVALGQPEAAPPVVEALIAFIADGPGPALATTAAVALGRTRAEAALEPLKALLAAEAWQLRAAGAEGLAQLSRPDCVPPLLAALTDEHSCVMETAHRALLAFSGRGGMVIEPADWPAWWEKNGKRATFRTKREQRDLDKRYGYGVNEAAIYQGLDVIVIPGRGDHIEKVLKRLGIKFRLAPAGKVQQSRLHPGAVLLVGCTGEIAPPDVEAVQWFVRSGGALFTSCWSLTYTVQRSFPALVAKFPWPQEVMDNVFAVPTRVGAASPFLRGVFDGGVQPYYSLVGAHLLEVLDPERVEVLLDSPSAATRHGCGDLAAWFRMGHGTVLDTANHFEEQGFSAATGLKKPIDRQAFAVNHMGLKPLQLRTLGEEKWWKSTSAASAEVFDLSVFRILTNFVRAKRIGR